MREKIEKKIKEKFDPVYLEVVDESDYHNNLKNYNTHIKLILVSDRFNDQFMLNRHRAIYNALRSELVGLIYALSLYTYTSKEWKNLYGCTIPTSPTCRNINDDISR